MNASVACPAGSRKLLLNPFGSLFEQKIYTGTFSKSKSYQS